MTINNDFKLVIICFLFFTILHFIFNIMFSQPFIFGDEVSYKTMAYSFYKYGDLYHIQSAQMGHTTEIPNFLYQLLISISFYFGDFFLVVIKLINSILISLIIFPLYLLLKEFIEETRWIFLSLILVLLIPDLNYSINVMPEGLFLLIFCWVIFFTYKYFVMDNVKFIILSAIFVSLLFLTKPHAIATIAAILGVFSVNFLIFLKNKQYEKIKITIRDIIIFLFTIIVIVFFLSKIFATDFSFGVYSNTSSFDNKIDLYPFIRNLIGHISTILTVFSIPIIMLIYGIIRNINFNNSIKKKKTFYFSLLTFILLLVIFSMVIKYTNDINGSENYLRIHARYYFYLYPLFIVSFFVLDFQIYKYKKLIFIFFVVFYIGSLFILIKNFSSQVGLITDNIQLVWLLILNNNIIVYLLIFILLILNLLVLFNKKLRKKIFIFMLFAYFIFGNIFHVIGAKEYHHSNALNDFNLIKKIDLQLNSDYSKNVTIIQNNGFDSLLRTVFWYPFNYNYAKVDGNLKVINENMILQNTDFVILIGLFDINFNYDFVVNIGKNINIYSLKKNNLKANLDNIYPDGWSKKIFNFTNNTNFDNLIIKLAEWQPNLPCVLNITTNKNSNYSYIINKGTKELIIPFSESYTFELSKTFNPSKIGMSNDNRELGLFIEAIYLEKDKK